VSQDWRAPLSGDKSHAYLDTLHQLETSYGMFSVNLDEALGMRHHGHLTMAYQLLSVSPALCGRFTAPLAGLLHAMVLHTRHFGITPSLCPLNPQNFRNPKSQRIARFNGLFSRVLLTQRSQFLYKISALTEMVEELDQNFDSAVEALGEGLTARPDLYWDILDVSHYDLNTCLRESVVILKCFLHALPEGQLAEFQLSLFKHVAASPASVPTHARHLAHRRLTPIKGQ
jgi:hypothetical protein